MTRVGHILDIDPDLGADFGPTEYAQARAHITAALVDVPEGPWNPSDLGEHPDVRGRLFACLVADGLSVRELLLADRVSTQLFGPGDLIVADLLTERSLPLQTRYQSVGGVTVALLDDRFLAASRRWPRLTARLMDLATDQMTRTSVHQAVSQLPRVEDRLLALFWMLADRWAQVSADGILVRLPLTHEALGRLVGARRPTVTLGLRTLAEAGTLMRRDGGEWLLDADSLAVLKNGDDPQAVHAVVRHSRPAKPAVTESAGSAERDALLRRVAGMRDQLGVGQARMEELLQRHREALAVLATSRERRREEAARRATAVA